MNSSPAFDPPGDAASGRYAVALLGDTHYDAEPESVYHSHYDESNRWAKIQHEEFRRNGEMWRGRCRDLVAAAGALARAEPTRFVLQIGDLVQGAKLQFGMGTKPATDRGTKKEDKPYSFSQE